MSANISTKTIKSFFAGFFLLDYHIYHIYHYLKQDVLLLANFFENFINTCLKFYKLIPCHDFNSFRLSWDAMLKMTRIKLEQADIAKYLFIEKGLRGRISYISKNYDPKKESKFIMDLDENNSYGWVMSQHLSYGRFKWFKNVDNLDVNSIRENNPVISFTLKVNPEFSD